MGKVSVSQCIAEILCNDHVLSSESKLDRIAYRRIQEDWNRLSRQARDLITDGLQQYLDSVLGEELVEDRRTVIKRGKE